jgi:ATP-dependent Lon protease
VSSLSGAASRPSERPWSPPRGVQGNIKPVRSLVEPLQAAKDNGAKRALIPIENKRSFLEVTADIVEHVDPVFYGDPKTAAMKVLGGS